jgi:hypothetical protein
MAYSILSNGLVCLAPDCGFELEMDSHEAREILEPVDDLVCCA